MGGKGEAMRRKQLITICAISFCGILASNDAQASSCEEKAKECFTYSDAERESCLHRALSEPSCDKTALGAIIAKRVQFSPTAASEAMDGPAFLGPQIVDKKCLKNFDSELSAGLIRGALSTENLQALSVSLDRCARSYAPDITRP